MDMVSRVSRLGSRCRRGRAWNDSGGRGLRAGSPARSLALLAVVVAALGVATGALGAITITRTSAPEFYIDTGDNIYCQYASYRVENTGPESYADVWVEATGFSGGSVSVAGTEVGLTRLGPIPAGGSRTAYFYLQAATATLTPQTHTVSVYDGRPPSAPVVASQGFSLSQVLATITASANKVTSVVSGPTPPQLGGIVTITVTGESGTIGSALSMAWTAASFPEWPAHKFELLGVDITLSGGNTAHLVDQLYYLAANTSNTQYVAIYTFRAIGTTESPTPVSSIAHISSGAQIKHTTLEGFGSIAPIPPAENRAVVLKSATPDILPAGGTTTFFIRVTNSGTVDILLDRIEDTLPTSPSAPAYVTGSSTLDGVPIADPSVAGSVLTWEGPFTVAFGDSIVLAFNADFPDSIGAYVNEAVGFIGVEQIDATADTGDDTPASAVVRVGNNSPDAVDDADSTAVNVPLDVDVLANDSDPDGDPLAITAVDGTTALGGTATVHDNGTPADPTDDYVVYTPPLDVVGIDTFTYTIGDPYGGTDAATVTITLMPDADGDGIPDAIDIDDDDDGVLDVDEGDGLVDSDGDGVPDSLDIDSDDDGIVDNIEAQREGTYVPPMQVDTDLDGWDDAYDPDNGGSPIVLVDTDGDGTSDLLDLDADDDHVPDSIEGHDANHDGVPDTVPSGADSDSDGLDDAYDTVLSPENGNETGSNAPVQDTDGDGTRDWRDTDDDDDGLLTEGPEDANGDGDPTNDDTDGDGTPDYLDADPLTDLSVAKTADFSVVAEGDTLTYAVAVTNNGPSQATGVTVTDLLPAGVTYLSDDGGGSYDPISGVWAVGTVDAGQTVTLHVRVTVDPGTGGTVVTNAITDMSSNEFDTNVTPDDLEESVAVSNDTDLVVTKEADDVSPEEGQSITFTLTVTNNGPARATNVSLTDVLPDGVTHVSDDGGGAYDPGTGVWTIGALEDGQSAVLNIVATVDAGTSGTVITNAVTGVSLDQNDTNATQDDLEESLYVGAETDLVVGKTVSDPTPDEGDAITYTLSVTNNGPAMATHVAVTDPLPAGVTYVSHGGDGTYDPGTGVWSVGTLANGQSAVLSIVATVDAGTGGTVVTNAIVSVSLDQNDTNATQDDLAEDITVGYDTDLVVGKTVSDPTPDEGDTITYTLTVTNNGPAMATNVSLTDTLPAGVTYVSHGGDGSYDPGTGLWVVGTVPSGESAVLTIVATVDAGAGGTVITNAIVGVSLDQNDTNATQDDLDEDVTVGNGTDLVVGKSVSDPTPNEGDTITYTLTVTNNGPARATNVALTDVLPTGVTYVSDDGGGAYDPGTGLWTIGTLEDGQSALLHIVVTVEAGTAGTVITNAIVNVSMDQDDTNVTQDDPEEDISVGNGTDLAVGKTVSDPTPEEGDTIAYTLTVTNNGPLEATNVSATDPLPAGVTYVSHSGDGTYDPGTGLWTIGTLGVGEGAVLTIVVTVDAGTSGTVITNAIVNVSMDQDDTNQTQDDPGQDISVGGGTDLVVAKTVSDPTPDEGDTITYTLTVTNSGPAMATNVVARDQLPEGVTYVSHSGDGTYDPNSGYWTIGTLAEGESAVLNIVATVDAGTAGTVITNAIVSVSMDQVDTNQTQDDPGADISVGGGTDLVVNKTVSNPTPDEGDTIVYTLTVTNNGPAMATNLTVTDPLPGGVTYVSHSGDGTYDPGTGLWTIGTLAAGESAYVNIVVTVNAGTAGTVITNAIVNVSMDQNDTNQAQDDPQEDISVGNGADLAVGKTVSDPTPDEGDTITYTLTVTNNGPAMATNVSVRDVLPDGVTYVSHSGAGSYNPNSGYWTIGALEEGESAVLHIVATVNAGTAGTVITNAIVGVSMDQDDTNVTEDDLEEDISVGNETDLAVTKTVNDPSPIEGQTVAFTLTVTNNGPATATNVSLTDPLPDGVTYVSHSGDGTYGPDTGVWTIGTLEEGESAVLSIVATVDAGTEGTVITNTITDVSLDQNDSNQTQDDLTQDLAVGLDTDNDGVGDAVDVDDDNDGILDVDEGSGEVDTDGDGHPDSLDIDADDDGIVDNVESQAEGAYTPPSGSDTDGDGLDDAYDPDNGGSTIVPVDTDDDGTPDCLDLDTDGDGVPDATEGHDANHDGHPDTVPAGSDSDSDGLDEAYDTVDGWGPGNEAGSNAPLQNTDGDDVRDWRDVDDDDDGIETPDEDLNDNGDFTDDDSDDDGTPDYLDPDIVVPGEIRLSKSAALKRATVGGMVPYTLVAENTSDLGMVNVTFEDLIPAGFALVEDSETLTRGGPDGELGTSDDATGTIAVSGGRPVVFGPIDLAGFEVVSISYMLRVGSGVIPGEHENIAVPMVGGEPSGNEARAAVAVEADATLDKTTIIGKVFHDRDGDGWQDPASASGLVIYGGAASKDFVPGTTTIDWGDRVRPLEGDAPLADGIELGDLAAAGSETGANSVVIRAELVRPQAADVTVTSREGTNTVLKTNGAVLWDPVGSVGGGFNGQDIVIKREIVSTPLGIPPEGQWTAKTRTVVETDTVKLRNVVPPIYFESGKSNITAEHIDALRRVIDGLEGKANIRLHIVGHTDNQPLGPRAEAAYGDNYGLGLSRAVEVWRILAGGLGLPDEDVSAESKGPDEPVASNDTPEGMARNRRAEVEVWYEEQVEREREVTDQVHVEQKAEPKAKHELVITVTNAGACEEGIAHARLATTDGLVIETDASGRYHLADADGGRFDRGGMFAIKADAAYLPAGSVFTTENPRVLRLTPGVTEQIDFGVKYPEGESGTAAGNAPAGSGTAPGTGPGSSDLSPAAGAAGEVGGTWAPRLTVFPDDYFFMVGMANLTVGQNSVSGSTDVLAGDYHYDDEVFTDGRIAFYLKSRFDGKLLLTAQMDTDERELEHIFDDLDRTDPRSIFRRLDPDHYYPTYGDDSVTFLDTESQGKFYARADWEKSRLMWGNYNTGLTGTELARYNRSLYGAMGYYATNSETGRGDSRVELTAFGSEAQTASAHVEFAATGGSLYYLKHTDIVQGSEKLWVEVRERESGRPVEKITLERGRDYEIDEMQGRAILALPLTQIVEQAVPSIIKDVPLDGNHVFLLADYEYVPDGFEPEDLTMGGRGKVWATDGVAVGATYVKEEADGADYELLGADVTLAAGEGTYLKAEYAASEAASSGNEYVSADGGLTFAEMNAGPWDEGLDGEALSIEGRVALPRVTESEADDALGAWWKNRDAGFSMSGLERGTEVTEYGGEGQYHVGSTLGLAARGVVTEREGIGTDQTYSAQADYEVTERLSLGAEVRHRISDPDAGSETSATLGGATVGYDLTRSIVVYGTGQFMLDKSDAEPDNNLGTLGIKGAVSQQLTLKAEASAGDLGTAVNVGADYALNELHTMYGTFTLSPDHTGGEKNVLTLGQRKTVSDQMKVFTEHQFSQSADLTQFAQVYGLDYSVTDYTTVGLSLQSSDHEDGDEEVDRDVASVYASYGKGRTRAGARLEYRRDEGTVEREQWLTTNSLDYRASDELTLQGKFSLSTTTNETGSAAVNPGDEEAKFVEAGVGFAYRPVCGDRLNLLGRYTYLNDLPGESQASERGFGERSHLVELEGLCAVNHELSVGGKIARKLGEIRPDGESDEWSKSEVNFAAARARYHIVKSWDGLVEYRWLSVKENDDARQGVLAGLYRQIGGNLMVGVGYNFTDFSDDLNDLDYESQGWFIDVTGSY